MLNKILAGIALGLGGYAVFRWLNPNWITTPDGEGQGVIGAITGDFLGVAYRMTDALTNVSNMQISLKGLAHIKGWEGFRSVRYFATQEERRQGKATIGYGHVIRSWENFNEPMSQSQAEALLLNDLKRFESAVRAGVKVPINQNQYDALVSLCFNIGETGFLTSTLLKKLNAGDFDETANQFLRWVYQTTPGGKVVVNGLVKRRYADMNLFKGVAVA